MPRAAAISAMPPLFRFISSFSLFAAYYADIDALIYLLRFAASATP